MGIPLAVYFGFTLKMGLGGFWYGYIIAIFLVDVVVVYLVISSPWKAEHKFEAKTDIIKQLSRKNSESSVDMGL